MCTGFFLNSQKNPGGPCRYLQLKTDEKKNEILKKEKKEAKPTSRKFIMKQTVRMLIKKKPTAEGHFTSTSQF